MRLLLALLGVGNSTRQIGDSGERRQIRLDRTRLDILAADSGLKLKGPVVVSEATLQSSATDAAQTLRTFLCRRRGS
jgi:hypothetical protein